MKYQLIEQHKHEFAIVVMCHVLGVEGSVACMPGASVLPVSANEKMLSSPKKFGRCLKSIRADTGVRASTGNYAIRGGASPANEWLA